VTRDDFQVAAFRADASRSDVSVPRMSWLGLCLVIGATASCSTAPTPPATSSSFTEGFESGELAEDRWYLGQAKLDLIGFEETSPREGRRALVIGVDETIPAERASSEGDSLRFGLVDPPTHDRGGEPCPPEEEHREDLVQRNEIRVEPALQADFGQELWYAFSVRMFGDIPECGSVRWVIGQWKHDTADSPFLAQRFDDGVFHVTVQDGHCRCLITPPPDYPDLEPLVAQNKPVRCSNTHSSSPDQCQPCESELRVVYGEDPRLPDPREGWVDMLYRIRGGRDDGLIDIYANGRFIARVTGSIGYEEGEGDKQYFKIGNYRNYMPGGAELHVDRIWRGEDPTEFDPDFKPRV